MKVAADFRRIARESLKGKWFIAVLAGVIAALLGAASWEGAPKFSINFDAEGTYASVEALGQRVNLQDILQNPNLEAVLAGSAVYIVVLSLVILVIQLIIGAIISAGYHQFHLDLVDGKEASLNTLFAYFPYWKTMVVASLLQTLYIILWTLLFIIPGIIAAYRYSMTFFILAEHPELDAGEAIDRSKELMDGNKWRLFCLGFSFIGWRILCVFTFGVGNLWLNPYIQTANAAFYRDITTPLAEKEIKIPLLESAAADQEGCA